MFFFAMFKTRKKLCSIMTMTVRTTVTRWLVMCADVKLLIILFGLIKNYLEAEHVFPINKIILK